MGEIHKTTLTNPCNNFDKCRSSDHCGRCESLQKEFLQQAICSTRRTGYYYIKRIITFLICAKEEQENPVKVIVERPKYRGGRACASCRPYPRDAYSVIQITTKTHEQPFSLQLGFALVLKWTPLHKKFAPASASGRSLFLMCRQQ